MFLRSFHPISTGRLSSQCHPCRPFLLRAIRHASSSSSPQHWTKQSFQQLRSNIQTFHQSTLRPRLDHAQFDAAIRLQRLAAAVAQHASALGHKLNEVTGYQEVEKLKALVTEQGEAVSHCFCSSLVLTPSSENTLQVARKTAREAKEAYDQAITNRSSAQREVNSLLERKHSWTDADVSAFTTLVRTDHASTFAVTTTSSALKESELAVDQAFSNLTSAILQRYHEEQVWSDKIRSVATWANVAGFLLNFFIFLVAIAIVEPWKRKRLVARVEERMTSLIARVEEQVSDISHRLEPRLSTAKPPSGAAHLPSPSPDLSLEQGTDHDVDFAAPRLDGPLLSSPRPYLVIAISSVLDRLGYSDIELTAKQLEGLTAVVSASAGIVVYSVISSAMR